MSESKKTHRATKKKYYMVGGTAVILLLIFVVYNLFASVSNDSTKKEAGPFSESYVELEKPIPELKGKIIEFFWFGCPHCYHAEPLMKDIEKIAQEHNLRFKKIHFPHPTNQTWQFDFRVYAAMEIMGIDEQVRADYMKAVQGINQKRLSHRELGKFLSKHNINVNRFKKNMVSDKAVNMFAKTSRMLRPEIKGTPAVIVDGKYLILDLNLARPVIHYLLTRKEQRKGHSE